MEENPAHISELLVGLGDVEVLGVDDPPGGPLAVHVRTRSARPRVGTAAGRCGPRAPAPVSLVDLATFGGSSEMSGHWVRDR